MGLIESQALISRIAPPLDLALSTRLVEEFISLEKRYILRDWEPAELDSGQYCEILGRLLYHADSGNLDPGRDFGDCHKYILNDQVPHNVSRDDAKMLMMAAQVVHKFRSKRGAVHISPTYKANHMDARFMIESVRWVMTEVVRVFWNDNREAAATAVRELLRFDVPAVGRFENVVLVQRTDLKPTEEILVLLHYAGEAGFTRKELGIHAKCTAPSVTKAITLLTSPELRQVVLLPSGKFVLTDLGHKRIREQLSQQLLLE
jgi:hypothetical protein